MKQPWQIWGLFLLCLAIVLPAMVGLTVKSIELDRAELAARREAELARQQADLARVLAEQQELINSALWRMDWTLTPLIAQEAARPYFVYRPFDPSASWEAKHLAGGQRSNPDDPSLFPFPSPLLMQPSEYVIVHFQLSPDGTWTSPQSPRDSQRSLAIANGITVENIQSSAQRLAELHDSITHAELAARLPDQWLPNTQSTSIPQPADSHSQAAVSQTYGSNSSSPVNDPFAESKDEQLAAQLDFLGGYATNLRRQAKRSDTEFQRRTRALNSFAQSQMAQQRIANPEAVQWNRLAVREGVSRPVWLGGKLILARRVIENDQIYVQGCWLDWDRIQQMLLSEVADLLPMAELTPVTDETAAAPGRVLATLPVQIETSQAMLASLPVSAMPSRSSSLAPDSSTDGRRWSPIQWSLVTAWICLLLATIAVAVLLRGVISLSERRGAFVSAVTHELRTPLTTFRMYAEMLAEGMVPSPDQRQHYLNTLRLEADRLSHLVENVLAYARLERGRHGARRETIAIDRLLERVEPRLRGRAEQAALQLVVEADDMIRSATLHSDPAAIEQILFNLVDNACKYASDTDDRRLHLQVVPRSATENAFLVIDHGPGITAQQAKRLFRPFSKSVHEAANTAPGVGLGLALCRRLARALGGQLELAPTQNADIAARTGAKFSLLVKRTSG